MKKPREYVFNSVMQSSLTGEFYFVPKAEVIRHPGEPSYLRVIGKKHDVTRSLQPSAR